MKTPARILLSTSMAAMLAVSVAAPAEARRYHRHRDGVDAGDVILGAIILGGIAAIAASASRARENGGWDSRAGDRTGDENAAVDRCVSAAENEAERRRGEARVSDIRDVERRGDDYQVRGTVEYRYGRDRDRGYPDRSDPRADGGYDTSRFTCVVRYSQVVDLRFADQFAWR